MTEDSFKTWEDFIHVGLNILCDLDMNISPVYIETRTIYTYTIAHDIEVYDIPIESISYKDNELLEALMEETKKSEDCTMFIRPPSEASGDRPSVIVPKDMTVIFSLGSEVTGVLFDNNVHHFSNPFIKPILEHFGSILSEKYSDLSEDE